MHRKTALYTVTALAFASLASADSASPAFDARAALERLKGLAGSWTMEMPKTEKGEAAAAADAPPTTAVTYRVTAGGSAVIETLFPGDEHEMVTVYHLDGSDLVLTHYCAGGNQPRMKAAPSSTADAIDFRFNGGSNLASEKDPHMHDASIRFVGPDRIHSEWRMWVGGKPGDAKVFDLKRVSPAK